MDKAPWNSTTPDADVPTGGGLRAQFSSASWLRAEIEWMADNAPHLNFEAALENAKIDEQVYDLLLRCQKKAAGGAS